MELPQFITNETGQAVCVDGTQNNPPASNNSGQCEQLSALWSQQHNGKTLPLVVGAVDLWNNAAVQAEGYTQITDLNALQPGDIIIYGASTIINSPKYGHTDIFVQYISGGYQGFDSNWGGVYNAAGYPTAHLVNHNFSDVLGGLRYNGGNMNPTAQQAHDTVMAFETEADGITPHQPTQADLDFGVSTPWNAYIPNFYPMVQRLRDVISLLTKDRDSDLYPKINATCAALGLPSSATTDEITTAIANLKKGVVSDVEINGQTYIAKV